LDLLGRRFAVLVGVDPVEDPLVNGRHLVEGKPAVAVRIGNGKKIFIGAGPGMPIVPRPIIPCIPWPIIPGCIMPHIMAGWAGGMVDWSTCAPWPWLSLLGPIMPEGGIACVSIVPGWCGSVVVVCAVAAAVMPAIIVARAAVRDSVVNIVGSSLSSGAQWSASVTLVVRLRPNQSGL
jgi:hypothetical protein